METRRAGWPYYAAIALFVAVLAFAVLGLVRSSTLAGAPDRSIVSSLSSASAVTPRAPALANGPVPTPRIPPPTRNFPTRPPSRTYLHPPPEHAATAAPEPAAQPRR
jgi:hypothetical protein